MTTTDLARMEQNAVAVLSSTGDALERLGQWVQAARDATALVAPLIDTAFVPDGFRPKIDPRATEEQKLEARKTAIANATAAVLQGLTLGVDPLVALQQIYIIHGRPGMYAKFMVALVQSRGHEVWTEDLSNTRAIVAGRRKGSQHTERVTITMDMARVAKWTRNEKYAETPQDMLWSRAAARICDRIASDVLKGIASVEEIRDSIQAEAEVVGNGTRTVSRRRATAPALSAVAAPEDPPLDEETIEASATEGDAETAAPAGLISAAQQRKMHALLRERDMADRDVALVWIAGTIEREIASTKELTLAEAGAVIDALEALPASEAGEEQPALDGDVE